MVVNIKKHYFENTAQVIPYFLCFYFLELFYLLYSANYLYKYLFVFFAGVLGMTFFILLILGLALYKNIARIAVLFIMDIHISLSFIYFIFNCERITNLSELLNIFFLARLIFAFIEILFVILLTRSYIAEKYQ